jgi:hypothetical protein
MTDPTRNVVIEWANPDCDWPWFTVVAFAGEWVCIRGRASPDGDPHKGESFWVHRSEIREMTVAK